MVHFQKARLIAILIAVGLVCNRPALVNAQSLCGQWTSSSDKNDARVEAKQVVTSPGSDCSNIFRFSNKTPLFTYFGGYAFRLKALASSATVSWSPGENLGNETYLMPGTDVELTTKPMIPALGANITVGAAMNIDTFTIDSTLFLISRIVPTGCFIPTKELPGVVLRTQTILRNTVKRAAQWDFDGTAQELSQVEDEFRSQLMNALIDAQVTCALEAVSKKATLVFDYITWVPVVITNNIRYWGSNSVTSLVYTGVSNLPSPVPPVVMPSASAIPRTSKIAFMSDRDHLNEPPLNGQHPMEVYIMDPDGSNQKRLTAGKGWNDDGLTWSADGRSLLLDDYANSYRVYIIESVTGKVLAEQVWGGYPSMTPDSTKVAYSHTECVTLGPGSKCVGRIYVRNLATNQEKLLSVPDVNGIFGDNFPAWSPDGKFLIYAHYVRNQPLNASNSIVMVTESGSVVMELKGRYARHLAWSPDGATIAFESTDTPHLDDMDIWTMDRDGKNMKRVTQSPGVWDAEPSWSPDNKQLVFSSPAIGPELSQIFVINQDGSNLRQLTSAGNNAHATWNR